MSKPEGAPYRFEQYQPVSTLLQNLDSRLRIAPWDQLDLDIPSRKGEPHLDPRQITPIESILAHTGYKTLEDPQGEKNSWRRLANFKRGFLAGVDVHVGTLELQLEEKNGLGKAETLLLQYRHNPQEKTDVQGMTVTMDDNPVIYNDGVANVFLQPDGRIQAFAMLPENGQAVYFPFAPDHLRSNELSYPENMTDALLQIRSASPQIDRRMLPLIGKLGRLVTAATDIWLNRETNYQEDIENLLKIPGDIRTFSITRDGIDPVLAEKLGAPVDEHPLAGLVDASLIPEKFEIIEMENYMPFLLTMAENNFHFPEFFRSHEMGMYFSAGSRWDNPDSASEIIEVLGYNGITDIGRGLIMPTTWPEGYPQEWNTKLGYLRHQMLLQVYEDLPEEQRQGMLTTLSSQVEHAVDLINHTYLTSQIPDGDPSSPYAFRKYSHPQQERILAGFIAGRLTLNKDLLPYWAGPPLKGEGMSREDWVPEGVSGLIEANGFRVSRAPESKVHEVYVTGQTKAGKLDKAERPYANPDLKIDEEGVVFVQKPVKLNEVTILEGFSLRPPLERLHQDLEEVYGMQIIFPDSFDEDERNRANFTPLQTRFYDSARRTVADALQKYPPEYIQKLGMEKLSIVSDIEKAAGTPDVENEAIAGLARTGERTLYYAFGANSEATLHHEIRHFADSQKDPVEYVEWILKNTENALSYTNKTIFDYMKAVREGTLGVVPDGFLSHYSVTSYAEDRAMIAAELFTHPTHLKRKMAEDPVIREKVSGLITELVKESDGAFSEEWWNDVLENPKPYTNPPVFGQLISYGYLTHSSDYLNALQRKARRQGVRTPYVR